MEFSPMKLDNRMLIVATNRQTEASLMLESTD
jgi:hypothetical protein